MSNINNINNQTSSKKLIFGKVGKLAKSIKNKLFSWEDERRGKKILSDTYDYTTYLLDLTDQKRMTKWEFEYVINNIPEDVAHIDFANMNFSTTEWEKLFSILLEFRRSHPDVALNFEEDSCIFDKHGKQLKALWRLSDENTAEISWVQLPENITVAKLDVVNLAKKIIARWVSDKDIDLLTIVDDTSDLKYGVTDWLFKLLKNKKEADNSKYNQDIMRAIAELRTEQLTDIQDFVESVKTTLDSMGNVKDIIKSMRVTEIEAKRLKELEENRIAKWIITNDINTRNEAIQILNKSIERTNKHKNEILSRPFWELIVSKLFAKVDYFNAIIKQKDKEIETIVWEYNDTKKTIGSLENQAQELNQRDPDQEAEDSIENDKKIHIDRKKILTQENTDLEHDKKTAEEEKADLSEKVKTMTGEQRSNTNIKIGKLNKEIRTITTNIDKNTTEIGNIDNEIKKIENNKDNIIEQKKKIIETKKKELQESIWKQQELANKQQDFINKQTQERDLYDQYVQITQENIDSIQRWDVDSNDIKAIKKLFEDSIKNISWDSKKLSSLYHHVHTTLSKQLEEFKKTSEETNEKQQQAEANISSNNKTIEENEKKIDQEEVIKDEYQQILDCLEQSDSDALEDTKNDIKSLSLKTDNWKKLSVDILTSLKSDNIERNTKTVRDTIDTSEETIRRLQQENEELNNKNITENNTIQKLWSEAFNTPSPLAKDFIERKENIEQEIQNFESRGNELDNNFNEYEYNELIKKLENDTKDLEHTRAIISDKIDNKINSNDPEFKNQLEWFGDIMEQLISEGLLHDSEKDKINFNIKDTHDDIDDPRWEWKGWKIKKWMYNTLQRLTGGIIGTGAAAGAGQLAVRAGMTSIAGIKWIMLTWGLWGFLWSIYSKKLFKQARQEATKDALRDGNTNRRKYMLKNKKVAYALSIMVSFAALDASLIGSVIEWKKKANHTISQIGWSQKSYVNIKDSMNTTIDMAQNKAQEDLKIVFQKEVSNGYGTWAGMGRNRVIENALVHGEAYVRNIAAGGNVKWVEEWLTIAKDIAKANKIELGVFDKANNQIDAKQADSLTLSYKWKTISWKDITANALEVSKGEMRDRLHNPVTEPIAAEITWSLPSTAMDLKKYITSVNELLTKDINSTKQEIEEYNKDMEALTKALQDPRIESRILLSLLDAQALSEKGKQAEKQKDVITDKLWDIETYSDIFTMINFVNHNETPLGKGKFFIALILLLALLHGVTPAIDGNRLKKRLVRYLEELKSSVSKDWSRQMNGIVNTMLPLLLTTPTGRKSLEDMNLSDEIAIDYMNQFLTTGFVEWADREKTEKVKTMMKTNLLQFVRNAESMLITLDNQDRADIDAEVKGKKIFGEPLCPYTEDKKTKQGFYYDHIMGEDTSKEMMMTFVGTLLEKSKTFREKFFGYADHLTDEEAKELGK